MRPRRWLAAEMAFPFFTEGLPQDGEARPSLKAEDIATLEKHDQTLRYRFYPELSYAINVAMLLGQPLLVTGEPGVGKSALAKAIADIIDAPLHRFETQSSSEARDLFYHFDAFAAYKQASSDLLRYIEYRALGKAILEAFPRERVADMLNDGAEHHGPRRAVVLIDEIDKAPRDFPNDLLNQIDRQVFRVPEIDKHSPTSQGESAVPANLRPIVIITSNSEKALPDAFLRRCVYHNIEFPKPARMREIIEGHDLQIDVRSAFVTSALDLFYDLRAHLRTIGKPPTTSELVAWLLTLRSIPELDLDVPITHRPDVVARTLGVLVKKERDTDIARKRLPIFCKDYRAQVEREGA